jgi:hypothetical protein
MRDDRETAFGLKSFHSGGVDQHRGWLNGQRLYGSSEHSGRGLVSHLDRKPAPRATAGVPPHRPLPHLIRLHDIHDRTSPLARRERTMVLLRRQESLDGLFGLTGFGCVARASGVTGGTGPVVKSQILVALCYALAAKGGGAGDMSAVLWAPVRCRREDSSSVLTGLSPVLIGFPWRFGAARFASLRNFTSMNPSDVLGRSSGGHLPSLIVC